MQVDSMQSQGPVNMEERGRRVREGNVTRKTKVALMGILPAGATRSEMWETSGNWKRQGDRVSLTASRNPPDT